MAAALRGEEGVVQDPPRALDGQRVAAQGAGVVAEEAEGLEGLDLEAEDAEHELLGVDDLGLERPVLLTVVVLMMMDGSMGGGWIDKKGLGRVKSTRYNHNCCWLGAKGVL